MTSDLHRDDLFQPYPSAQQPAAPGQSSRNPFEDHHGGASVERPLVNTQYSQGSPLDSPSSSAGSFSPPLRSTSRYGSTAPTPTRPGPNPTGSIGTSSYQSTSSHLRQRSMHNASSPDTNVVFLGTDHDEAMDGRNPFKQPVFAAMMNSKEYGESSESIAHSTAGMGTDRAEWVRFSARALPSPRR